MLWNFRPSSYLQWRQDVFVGSAGGWSARRHADIEITFEFDDFELHDKEDQQLKHDVNH